MQANFPGGRAAVPFESGHPSPRHGGDPSASHAECFACGVSSPGGLRLHFEVGVDGVARADWTPERIFRSYPDRIHGGILTTLLDSAMVHALFRRGVAGVTVEMTTRFKGKVEPAGAVHVEGRVTGERHGVYFCEAHIAQAERLAVQAKAKFMSIQTGEGAEGTLPSGRSLSIVK